MGEASRFLCVCGFISRLMDNHTTTTHTTSCGAKERHLRLFLAHRCGWKVVADTGTRINGVIDTLKVPCCASAPVFLPLDLNSVCLEVSCFRHTAPHPARWGCCPNRLHRTSCGARKRHHPLCVCVIITIIDIWERHPTPVRPCFSRCVGCVSVPSLLATPSRSHPLCAAKGQVNHYASFPLVIASPVLPQSCLGLLGGCRIFFLFFSSRASHKKPYLYLIKYIWQWHTTPLKVRCAIFFCAYEKRLGAFPLRSAQPSIKVNEETKIFPSSRALKGKQ